MQPQLFADTTRELVKLGGSLARRGVGASGETRKSPTSHTTTPNPTILSSANALGKWVHLASLVRRLSQLHEEKPDINCVVCNRPWHAYNAVKHFLCTREWSDCSIKNLQDCLTPVTRVLEFRIFFVHFR